MKGTLKRVMAPRCGAAKTAGWALVIAGVLSGFAGAQTVPMTFGAPVTSGPLAVTSGMVSFSEVDRRVTIADFMLPPGISTFTLRTEPVGTSGTVENEATPPPTEDSGFPETPISASASFEVPGSP